MGSDDEALLDKNLCSNFMIRSQLWVTGLIRAGAIREDEKPLWYDVYAAFPPKVEPQYDREVPKIEVKNILYPEDFIRREFYDTLGNPDIVNLSNSDKTKAQIFVEKYVELQKENKIPDEELFQATLDILKLKGFKLVSSEEIKRKASSQTEND